MLTDVDLYNFAFQIVEQLPYQGSVVDVVGNSSLETRAGCSALSDGEMTSRLRRIHATVSTSAAGVDTKKGDALQFEMKNVYQMLRLLLLIWLCWKILLKMFFFDTVYIATYNTVYVIHAKHDNDME